MAELKDILSSNKKILLHACCGVCAAYPISLLQNSGYEVVVYFYNPNIYPQTEYEKRLEGVIKLCNHFGCELITGDYESEVYYSYIKGLEQEPEKGARCDKCFQLRLDKSAQKAQELGIKIFTTSMVISPYKNYEKLTTFGEIIASQYDLLYMGINFRKKDGFLKTNVIANSLKIYRQNYCGCEFAMHH